MNAESFLRNLFRGTTGYIGIYDSRDKTTQYYDSILEVSEAAARAQVISEGGGDAYMNVCTRVERLDQYRRGAEREVPSVQVLWADIDYGLIGHKSDKCPPTIQDAYTLFEALPRPSIVVNSAGGLHCYWLLQASVPTAEGKKYNKALQSNLSELAAAKDWHVDAQCYSPAWMLRVPGTFNYKAAQTRPVSVISAPLSRYSLEHFAMLVGASPSLPRPTLPAGITARLALRDWLKTNRAKKTWADPILNGEPFAEPGERDTVLNAVCATIAFVDCDSDPEDLVEVLRASLDAMELIAPCDKDPIENAIDKLRRHQATARAERTDKEKWAEEARELQTRAARKALVANATTGIYTEPELTEFARKQKCSVEEFRKRWIIQKGDSFYVFVNGRYMPPISRSELETSLPRDLAPAPIDWYTGKRTKKPNEIVRDYGTVARTSQANMCVPESYYDDVTQTFIEAACKRREIKPEYDPNIHEWLVCLGGIHSEKLLDWIATVTDLSRQTCALYFVGKPGDGKTMFAEGLSRIYTTGAPTELESIFANFNEGLLLCPIIFGDETLPRDIADSGSLRHIIGSNTRRLKRKHKAEGDLVGAPRLVLAANNDSMLNFNENLSTDDQRAIAARFLYIVPQGAGAYLERLGGRAATDDWVSGDKIAAHALWLRENRHVTTGKRFLVEADSTALSRMLATSGKWPSLVCEWLARHLDQPMTMAASAMIRVGNGEFLVNASTIVEYWTHYIKSSTPPSTALVGRTLSSIATSAKTVQIFTKRYHSVDLETLFAWVERNHVGDVDAMRRKVNAPLLASVTPISVQ